MRQDVELSLEVQVDPESKKILSNLDKCRSTLLDVTVIKPKELDAVGAQHTKILRAIEVRKLITSLEKQRRRKQRLLDKMKCDDTLVRVCQHDNSLQAQNLNVTRTTSNPFECLERKDFIGITESVEPLFCEIKRSLKNVETKITNMKDVNLVISQTTVETVSGKFLYRDNKKNPVMQPSSVYRTHISPENLRSFFLCENQLKAQEGPCFCQTCGTVGMLTECQKRPFTELKASPVLTKDLKLENAKLAFERVSEDTKIIKALTERIDMLERRISAQEEKIVAKDYFKRIISKMMTNLAPKVQRSKSDAVAKEKVQDQTDKGTATDEVYTGQIWRWGEEILKPGIDLKNRIVNLIQDLVGKGVDVTHLEKATVESPKPESFRTFMNYMNTKVLNNSRQDQDDGRPERLSSEHVHVSYLNSKLQTWNRDSNLLQTKGKEEFMKIASKSKQYQKDLLWRNIWHHARVTGLTRDDKITIKIPSGERKNGGGVFEAELTIREVEEILKI